MSTVKNGVPKDQATVPALPTPELPQAAVAPPTEEKIPEPTVSAIASATVSKTVSATISTTVSNEITSIPTNAIVKNEQSVVAKEIVKSPKAAVPRTVTLNPLTAIALGKSAILTRQHKNRIRIKYSNLRNANLRNSNVLNEHNMRSPPTRKREQMATRKGELPPKSTGTANENQTVLPKTNKTFEELVKFADIDDIQLPDGTKIAFESDLNKIETGTKKDTPSPTSSTGTIVRKTKKKVRKIVLTKNTKLHRFDSKEKLFSCRHCGKLYRWKSTLRRHENDECGNKEPAHQCPYCDYKAKQRGNLGVHVRKHHADKPKLESSRKRRTV